MGKEKNSRLNFMKTLEELENGDVIFDASVKLQEVIDSVKTHGGKGAVTIKLEVQPLPNFGENAFNVVPSVSSRAPEKGYKNNIRFADDKNQLVKDDPAQMRFDEINESFKK